MSIAELARQIDVPSNRVTQILYGARAIIGDTALRLGHFFSTSAEPRSFACICFMNCAALSKRPENPSRRPLR